ncbi:MAG: L,D-transpeptidase family protein [Anaerolineae bacterium]
MPTTLTRRHMLKLIAAATTTALLTPRLHARAWYPTTVRKPQIPITPEPAIDDAWQLRGRAIHTVVVYEEATTSSERKATFYRDESFPILGEVQAPFTAHNDRWYQVEDGYVHSAWVLPVRVYAPQPLLEDLGAWGFWGEVSQIYTEARTAPSVDAPRKYRFYGGTVYHVIQSHLDEAGTGWYKVVDDYPPRQTGNYQWVLARDVRRVPRSEITPIHPFVGEKRIVVDLSDQTLTCLEGETPVYKTLVASGLAGAHSTPTGDHCVLLKQGSRHMANVPYADMPEAERPAAGDIFDLPGVPWNVFFDLQGRAIHGAYWHNDFGIRRSHGCLNVSIDAARWIYRWVHPIGGFEDDFIQSDCRVGTPITIF